MRATKITQSGQSAAKKKKKYVYFDNLLFLLPALDTKVTASNFLDDTSRSETEATVQSDDSELAIPDETTPLHVSPVQTTPAATTRETKRKRPRNVSSDVTEIREMTKLLSDNLALQSENIQKDTFGNKAFLMSLVPLLDAMSEDDMFDCRVSLMDAVRLYRSPRSVQRLMPNTSKFSMVPQSAGLQSSSTSRPLTPTSDASFQSQSSLQGSMPNVSKSYVVLQPAAPQSSSTPASDALFESQMSVQNSMSNNTPTSYMYMSQSQMTDSTPFDLYPTNVTKL